MRITRQGLFIAKPFGLTIVVARFVTLSLFRRARPELKLARKKMAARDPLEDVSFESRSTD